MSCDDVSIFFFCLKMLYSEAPFVVFLMKEGK